MRKLNPFLFVFLLVMVPMLMLVSCTDDDDDDGGPSNDFQPVLNENFSFTIDGNDVIFTTTLTGNVWVTVNENNFTMVDQTITVNLPNQGTYTFTCSSLGSGEVLTSDPFEVEIEQDDLGFLDEGLWKALSGGANETKTWKLDFNADAEVVYFDGPLSFSGYADGEERPEEWVYWAWDVLPEELPYEVNGDDQASFFNWQPVYEEQTWVMAPGNYGTITFDATNGSVITNIFGEESNGTFQFNDETWKMSLSGVHLPIDTARLNEPQYLEQDLANVRIFTLTDSAMQIGIKRTYEGFDEDGNQNLSQWVNVYNFIVEGYNYPPKEQVVLVEPIITDFDASELEGTWVLAEVPFGWVSWETSSLFDAWESAEEMIAATWLSITQDDLDAAAAGTFTFNNDGTCNMNGVETTYSVSDGVIAFGDPVEFSFGAHWNIFSSTTYNVLDVLNSGIEGGIWIGYQNEAKSESTAVHLMKL